MGDSKVLRREPDGSLVTHADVSAYVGGLLNDMVVDSVGHAYVGNFGFDLMGGTAPIETASLVRIAPDGATSVAARDLWFPNGSAITPDGKTLLVNETFGNRVTAFDIGGAGSLLNRRVWASFGDLPGHDVALAVQQLAVMPDGASLDAEGALWVADSRGGRVLRVQEGGEILDEISTGSGVFACMLGGADGRTLFCCVAPDFHAEKRKAAKEASIVAVRVDVPHATGQ